MSGHILSGHGDTSRAHSAKQPYKHDGSVDDGLFKITKCNESLITVILLRSKIADIKHAGRQNVAMITKGVIHCNFESEFCQSPLKQVISLGGHLWNSSRAAISVMQVQLLSLWMGKHQILQSCWPSLQLNFIFEITNEIWQKQSHKCCLLCSNSI